MCSDQTPLIPRKYETNASLQEYSSSSWSVPSSSSQPIYPLFVSKRQQVRKWIASSNTYYSRSLIYPCSTISIDYGLHQICHSVSISTDRIERLFEAMLGVSFSSLTFDFTATITFKHCLHCAILATNRSPDAVLIPTICLIHQNWIVVVVATNSWRHQQCRYNHVGVSNQFVSLFPHLDLLLIKGVDVGFLLMEASSRSILECFFEQINDDQLLLYLNLTSSSAPSSPQV